MIKDKQMCPYCLDVKHKKVDATLSHTLYICDNCGQLFEIRNKNYQVSKEIEKKYKKGGDKI